MCYKELRPTKVRGLGNVSLDRVIQPKEVRFRRTEEELGKYTFLTLEKK